MTVTEFYTKFKSLWDELSELQPLPEALVVQQRSWHREKSIVSTCSSEAWIVILLLMLKGTILNTVQLPSLRRTFNHILRDEA
ncbi:hypothetical protein SESBI_29823 [Sesbania bispinosa]|nr:hypothetical protein SESBI_29823 [Sesbania bispinosa]